MASWLQKQFHRAEELLEVVDRTAGNLAVIRERDGVGYASSDDQQSGSESTSGRAAQRLPPWTTPKEKRPSGSPNKHLAPAPVPPLPPPPPGQAPAAASRGAALDHETIGPESAAPAGDGNVNGILSASGLHASYAEDEGPSDGADREHVDQPAAIMAAAGEPVEAMGAAAAGGSDAAGAASHGTPDHRVTELTLPPLDSSALPTRTELQASPQSTANGPAVEAEDRSRAPGGAEAGGGRKPEEPEVQAAALGGGDAGGGGGGPDTAAGNPREDAALLPGGVSFSAQQELDEVRGLVKTSAAAATSKEARLAKICQQLSARLQEYKAENAQLEELIAAERERYGSTGETVRALQQQLASAHADIVAVEASSAAAMSAKNAELEMVTASLSETKRHVAMLEGKLATLQATTDVITKTRNMSEARMLQALKEELMEAERRAEEERIAHAETRQAATEREVELEQRVTESVAALTRMQRVVDDRTMRAANLEEKISLLEVECATINQELQQAEQRLRREQKRPPDEGGMSAQVQAWKEEAERARASLHEAEAKLAAEEAMAQKLRVELEARRRDGDSSSQQAHAELEKRFRELTELLYLKQTQLEAMSSEKQAALLQLEKETKRFREAKAQAERDKTMRRNLSVFTDDEEQGLRSLDALGVPQRQGMGKSIHSAAKILDSGAVTAGRFLWRRPLARVVLLLYLMFLHMMLMYFLHRLQDQTEVILSLRTSASSARDSFLGRFS